MELQTIYLVHDFLEDILFVSSWMTEKIESGYLSMKLTAQDKRIWKLNSSSYLLIYYLRPASICCICQAHSCNCMVAGSINILL